MRVLPLGLVVLLVVAAAPAAPASDAVAPRAEDFAAFAPARERPALELLEGIFARDPIARLQAAFPGKEAHAGAVGAAGTFNATQRAGDLDGDGAEDVLVETVDAETHATLRFAALSGPTGAPLWEIEPTLPMAVLALRDGTLLFMTVEAEDVEEVVCVEVACAYVLSGGLRWTFGRLDGTTGAPLWEKVVTGEARTVRTIGLASSAIIQEDASIVFAVPCGAILCVTIIDQDQEALLVPSLLSDPYLDARFHQAKFRSVGVLVSLDDGATIDTLPRPEGPEAGILDTAGDVDGDGAHEPLWLSFVFTPRTGACLLAPPVEACQDRSSVGMRLELLDGVTRASRWRADFLREPIHLALPRPARMDLDADGIRDLVLRQIYLEDGVVRSFEGPLMGADGGRPWAVERSDLMPLGDVGGSPGADLVRFTYAFEGGVNVFRVDGATGAAIGPVHQFHDRMLTSYGSAADRTGDGVFEILATSVPSCACAPTTRHLIIDGRTDAALADVEVVGHWGGFPLGGGAPGIAALRYDTPEIALLDDEGIEWALQLRAPGFGSVMPFPYGDLDGQGGNDVLAIASYAQDGVFEDRLLAVAQTGAVLWDPSGALANG